MFNKKTKIYAMAISIALSFLTLLTPVMLIGGAVAAPAVAIYNIFSSIGDFVFGSGESNDVIDLINQYLNQKETKKLISNTYQPSIDKEKDINISLHWLVIPNLLAGIEKVEKSHVQAQISAIKESGNELESYINILRKKEPWTSAWRSISTTTIASYINQFNSYLGQEDSLDIDHLGDKELLYPLKDRATVTSEFGSRGSVDTGNGSTSVGHSGIDLAYNGAANTCGVPIYSATDGEVVKTDATVDQAGANWGSIRFENLEVWYLHMRDPFPYTVGTKVRKGQFVGYIGTSGLSTGCHLHFETRVNNKAVNPRNFIEF